MEMLGEMEQSTQTPFSFTKEMSPTDASQFLAIGSQPSRMLRELGLKKGPLELIRVRGRGVQRWTVNLSPGRKRKSKSLIMKGWKKFVADNKLMCGNVLHFTLMSAPAYNSSSRNNNNNNNNDDDDNDNDNDNSLPHQLKVQVTRSCTTPYLKRIIYSAPSLKNPQLASKSSVPPFEMEAIRSSEDNCNSKKYGAAYSPIPIKELAVTFYIRIQHLGDDLFQPFILQIPRGVTKLMRKQHGTTRFLCDCKRMWMVELVDDDCKEGCVFWHDSGGFLRDHEIEEGDLCIFKSISFDRSTFHVDVYKSQHGKPYCPNIKNLVVY